MKNKLLFHQVLILVVILTVFIGVISVSSASKKVEFAYHWKALITNLTSINNDIDFLLERVYLDAKYDEIMSLSEKFGQSVEDILQANTKFYDSAEIDLSDIKRIKKIFEHKFDLICAYTSVVSLSRAIYVNLFDGKDGKYFNEIMPILALLQYNISTDLRELNQKLDQFLAIPNLSEIDSEFLKNSKVLVQYYMQAQGIFNQIHALGFKIELSDIVSKNQNVLYEATNGLENVIILFVICLLVVAILGVLSYIDARKVYVFTSYLKQALDSCFSSVFFVNRNKTIVYANTHFLERDERTIEEISSGDLELSSIDGSLKGSYLDITKAISDGKSWQNSEFINTKKNGDLIYDNIKFTPLLNDANQTDGYIFVKLDRTKEIFAIKELEKREAEIEQRAYVDSLTGLGNYYSLVRALESEQSGTIVYISINNFIDFRFFYKASTIELIVASFARSLKLCIDTYNIKASIYRVQFDEFYIWYNGEDIRKDIEVIKGYINSENLFVVVDNKREVISNIKTTIGVSLSQDTRQTTRITQAMLAHHDARNKSEAVSFYTENSATEQQYYHNQVMSRTIEYAIYNNTVIVECQGIFDVSDIEAEPHAKYYEILVRLIDENGKIRYPGEFLDIAKKISLYTEITKRVIEHAFRLVERFPEISFSINLSSSDIENEEVRELLSHKLKTCSYPDHVYFEILESEGMQDYKKVNDFIRKIRSHKCKISIDDFGSGYSNYYRLLELDIDVIKIDGSIVKKLPYDVNARDLLSTIIDFANRQDYGIVAEFVSTPEILEEIRKFGIKYAQGFLLGKPVSPDKI
ncbi:MAG: EAL domain-containing protein [Campylobacter sp.]